MKAIYNDFKETIKILDILMVLLVIVLVAIGIVAISSAQHVNSGEIPYMLIDNCYFLLSGLS